MSYKTVKETKTYLKIKDPYDVPALEIDLESLASEKKREWSSHTSTTVNQKPSAP